MNNLVYEIVTDRIVKKLEQGVIPWKMNWTQDKPINAISKKPYNGINYLLLQSSGYSSNQWLTYNQCKLLGGQVKRGEKGMPVIFWKLFSTNKDNTEEQENEKLIPMLRYYTVFNITQTTITPKTQEKHVHKPIEEAEAIIRGYNGAPLITHNEQRAYYRPTTDTVNMPKPETFTRPEDYYSTLFHELTHSTGADKRLKRFDPQESTSFGSQSYSNEELVAELGACYLSSDCGIQEAIIDNSASYISGWLSRLKNDKKLLVMASAKATKSSNYIKGIVY